MLQQVYQQAAEALGSTATKGRNAVVAVWPASSEGFVDELQILTEKEWQRLLRVGLRLSPNADVKELYCFRNVPAFDGVAVRVLRLAEETQLRRSTRRKSTTTDQSIWKVLKKSVKEVNVASEASTSKVETTPPRKAVKNGLNKSISPEEVQRRKRRINDDESDGMDEIRPPVKTRRLEEDKNEERSAMVAPIRCNKSSATTSSKESSGSGAVEVNSSEKFALSARSKGRQTVDEHQDDQNIEPTSDTGADSPISESIFSIWRKVIAAGMALDSDDEYDSDSSPRHVETASGVSSLAESTRSFWGVLDKAVSGFRTKSDSLDYDLKWTEEKDQKRWTMFGEPSVAEPPGKQRSKWKLW